MSVTAGLANNAQSDLLQWLSPYDHCYRHNVIVRERVEGTGQWILGTESYVDWKTSTGENLLYYGPHGVGKTVLAYALPDRQTVVSLLNALQICNH
jgi:Cdc6-like AAA superfamily ATPase